MPAIRRTDNRPAARHDPARAAAIEDAETSGRQQPFESIKEAEDLEVQLLRGECDPAQNRVQPGAIPAAGQDTDAALHSLGAKLENLLRINHPPGGGPLIVKLPAHAEELLTFFKTICAPEHYDDEVARHDSRVVLAEFHHFRFATGGENQAITRPRGAS